ncbi:MAG: hypothetical protein EZS28_054143, partial [Streblomastix strix]
KNKTVRYFRNGTFDHITNNILGNASFNNDGQRVAVEVDMRKVPRKVTFYVDGMMQPNYVVGIPSAIRFWVHVCMPNSQYTVKILRLSKPTAKYSSGSRPLEWEKRWE